MAAQVEVSSGRQDGVSGCLHLSPLTDSSNTALVEDSSGTHPSLILAPEPRKPLPGPKPRLTPKPFSVERTSIIRPILAPKPQPKPKPESTLPASQKPEHPDSSKPEPSGKPKAPGSRPAPTAFRPDSGAAQRPDAPLPKLAVTPDTVESSKPTPTPRTRVLPTRPAEWSGAVRPRPSGTPIARAKSMGFLSGAGLEDDGEEKAGEKSDPVVLRSQGGRSGRPRPVSAVFLSPPSQPETPPAASGPAPRWGTRRPLSTNLTAKFEPHQRPTKLDSKENIPETSEPKETAGGAAGGATGKRREKEDVETGGRSKALERGPVKEEAKPEEKAGSSIKRRISLLLDSSSSSFSLPTTRAAAPGAEPRSPGPPISDGDGTVGVKQRIRELSEDFSATPTPPKPQFKPRPLPTDLTKRFVPDLENCPADSKGLPNEEATEKSESSLGTEQSASPEDRASREGPDSVAPAPSVGGVQTVRAALFENVVERHNVHMLEDGGPTAQPGGSVTPTPRRSLSGRGTLRPPASVEEEGSLVMATLREASSPPSTRRVGHVFDTVVAVEGTRAVSETLSPAQPEERALALRSRRSEPRGEPRQQSARPTAPPGDGNASMSTISDPHKEQDGQAGRSALETGNTRYLRVGALVKWDSEGVDEESEVERVKQRELLKNMEEELQRQMEVHKAATADMEEEEREIEAERQKRLEAERQKRLEAERQKQLEAERQKQLEAERQKQLEAERQKQLEAERQKRLEAERQKQLEAERQKQLEAERQKRLEAERLKRLEAERLKQLEAERLKQLEAERLKQLEAERLKQLEAERQKQLEAERQKQLEAERQKQLEAERQKRLEAERQKRLEAERQKRLETERQKRFEAERLKQLEAERLKQLEAERLKQLEAERLKQLEAEKQKQLEAERQKRLEAERQKQLEAERQKQLEAERQKQLEAERQKQLEAERQKRLEAERQKQLEAERQKQLEAERQKQLETERQKQLEAERVRERERERRGREREEAAATRQSKVLKAEEPQSTRPRATYFALTGQAHDAPLQPAGTEEHRGTRSAERGRAEVPFDDYSVKVGRWGSPRRAVSMRYKPSEDDAFRRNAPDPQPRARSRERALEHGDQQSSMEEELERERRRLEEYGRMKEMNREKQDRERKKEAVAEERQKTEYERRKELEQQREFEREKERMLDQERLQLREFEKQREMERQKEVERQRELEKERGKQQDRQRDVWRWMQPDQQRAEDRQRGHDVLGRTQQPETRPESETSPQQSRETVVDGQRTSESHLRPKVLDLDTVSLDSRLSRGGVELGSAPQWRLPSGHDAEASRSSVLDVDSFRSQMQPDLSLDPFSTAPLGMLQSHQRYHPNPAFQPSHTSQPSTAPQGFGLPQPLTPERAGVGRQPGSEWLASQSDTWAERETAVDEPLWVSTGGSRRAISGRQSSLEELLQRQENSSPLTTPTAPGPAPRAQGPTPTPTSSIGISMLIPEKVWTPPVDGSSVGGVGSPAPSVGRKESQVSTGQTGTSVDVPEPAWSPNWELTSPEPSQTSHRSTLTQESRARSRSVSRRSPAESSVDGPLSRLRSRSAHREYGRQSWEQVKETVSGQDEARDTDTLVQETDSQYGTWDTGLHTDDSLTPATPSSDGNLTPSPRKPSPPLSPVQAAPADTPTSPAPLSEEKAEPLSFPETPTTLLDSSVLRSRVQLSKRCSRRAPSSRTARHSTALSLLAEGGGDEWRYRDSTEDKPDSLKQEVEEEMDSEEQDQGAESRTPTQPQRVAVFPGMNPSALMAQLKRRGDAATQPDGPVPSTQPSRSPKSPFLPRAARVLPPAANKENREESSPQWLKELKTKKRFSQLETDD
ncbi:uncharacterized protein LOC143512666 [Brachyhypopomus gauderio]|uniref:uncharacterized protein LOC143512666 n=1 Tax=Brachyhypopomus gauderio TaxID=698409 RepID=UPI004041440B